jgi:hypothetical protein
MPKRVIDYEAMWASDKIDACPEWAQAEYAWCYGLADANGSFELTNLRVPHSKVAAIRKSLSLERFKQIIEEFQNKGLLFVWTENGKRYGHWTGSDKPGRLPRESRRTPRYGPILAPPVPKEELAAYVTRSALRRETGPGPNNSDDKSRYQSVYCDIKPVDGLGVGLGLGEGVGVGVGVGERASHTPAPPAQGVCDQLVAIWNVERGPLPEVLQLTGKRCQKILTRTRRDPRFVEKFQAVIRKARDTPFLCGGGARGWRADFDWFIANDTNSVAVIEGKYDRGNGGKPNAEQRTRDNLRAAGLVN